MRKNNQKNNLRSNQKGLVSFVVTIIIMIILSLIVLGFARLSRREQRQSLDRQLNTQAFYAAESGVNDTIKYINDNLNSPGFDQEKGDCDPVLPGYSNVLDPNGPIEYTCVLYDSTPAEVTLSSTDETDTDVVLLQSANGTPIEEIYFYWQDKDGGTDVTGCKDISGVSGLPAMWWLGCETGILRVDLVPYATTASPGRITLIDRQMTAFMYPMAGADTNYPYASAAGSVNQGAMMQGGCNSNPGRPRLCRVAITGLGGLASDRFYARIKGLYRPSAVTIRLDGAVGGGNSLETSNYQVKIDVTGKANDVLRRIQVHARINKSVISEATRQIMGNGFAVQTRDSVCKRTSFAPPDNVIFTAPAGANNSCDPYQQP